MLAINYAQLCLDSYNGGPQFKEVEDQCYGVFNCQDVIAVIFRGSANALNWIRDLEAIPKRNFNHEWVHHGFADAAEILYDGVTKDLCDLEIEKPLVFGGHSLGGAIAVQFAQRYGTKAITFGCPRVWWHLCVAPIIEHYRFVCDDDPVPDLPPIFFGHDNGLSVFQLADQDNELVNPEDHFITHYIQRMGNLNGLAI